MLQLDKVSLDSIGNVATSYGLDSPGFESQKGATDFHFFKTVQTGSMSIQCSTHWVP